MARESIIQVFYGGSATTAPGDLYDGEFAFANGSGSNKKLFIGSGGNNTANWIGAIIEDQSTINWSSVTSENNKIPTQYAVKSLSSSYLPLAGGSMTGDITLGTAAEINFTATGGGGGTIKIQAPSATTGNSAYTFTLPVNDGSANEVLTTDGNGALSWASAGTATNVSVSNDDSSTTTYIAFTTVTSGNTGILVDGDGLTYNASTDTLTLAGDAAINGGDVTTTASTATLFNANATTLNLGGAATAITMGDSTSATTTIRGGTLVGNTTTQNLFNTTATTLNVGGAATAITMGATASTTTTIRGGTLVGNTTTQNLFNSTATTLNIGGAATSVSIGAATGTLSLNNPNINLSSSGATFYTTGPSVGNSHLTFSNDGEVRIAPTNTNAIGAGGSYPSIVVQNQDTGNAQVQITGGNLYLGRTTANGITYSATSIIFEGSTDDGFETTVTVTDPTQDRTITLPNASGTVALVAGSDTQVMFNDGGSALGGDSGLTYNKSTGLLTVGGDLAVNGSTSADITTTTSSATLFNANATTITIGAAATTFTLAGASAAQTVTIGGSSTGDSTYNLATGATGGTNTTTINIGTGGTAGSTTNVNIGTVSEKGTVTVGNNLTVTGNLTVSGTTITANVDTVSIEDPLLFLANNNTSSDAVDIGFYGVYDTSGSQDLYCGFFRDATDNKFKLYVGSQSAPSGAVISTSATGYATATLVANISGGTF